MGLEPAAPRPRDAGVQGERTALAWNRTGLSVLVNAALALRSGWTSGEAPVTVLAFALLVASGAAIFYGAVRRRQLVNNATAPPAIAIAIAAVVTLVACATGFASILVHM